MRRRSQKVGWYIFLFLWILTILGCNKTKTFNDLENFEKYVKGDNSPYLQTISKSGRKVSLRYMPTDAMMINSYRQYLEVRTKLQEDTLLSKEQRISKLDDAKNEVLRRKNTYDQSLYFHLTIGFEDDSKDIVYDKMQKGYEAYSHWLQKLMFNLQQYIYLQTAAIDEIPLGLYHMERTFGMRKSRTFLLMFPAQFNEQHVSDPDNDWLKLRIKEFGLGTGTLTLEFKLPFEVVRFQIGIQNFRGEVASKINSDIY